ncbi:Hpt domain-containing protein [Colwellia chukchiensis]|uniref:Hpt domain-containing protein n=1 Tax=Colwellia chukchiensis TaxID=641665 RepID=UPI000A16FA06|nr:Hpt domain-containing protein [Colwellia chukchiensis]
MQLLHKLKGAAIGLGLRALHQLCQDLELSAKLRPLSDEQLRQLSQSIASAATALQQFIQQLTDSA